MIKDMRLNIKKDLLDSYRLGMNQGTKWAVYFIGIALDDIKQNILYDEGLHETIDNEDKHLKSVIIDIHAKALKSLHELLEESNNG